MKGIAIIGLTFFTLILFSCKTENQLVVEQSFTFPSEGWHKYTDVEFTFDVEDIDKTYSLVTEFEVLSDYYEPYFKFKAVLNVGEQEYMKVIQVANVKAVSITDSTSTNQNYRIPLAVFPLQYFNEKGPYKIKLVSLMPHLYTRHLQKVEFKVRQLNGKG